MENQNPSLERVKTQTQVRVGLVVVVFLAAASIVLGAIQISRTIKAPFLPKSQSEALADLSTEEQRKEELKKLDTDKDGLTDYDETYIYNTSPFIEDSDSDGLPDKAEVLAGEDPNCPKGRICFAPQAATSTPEAASAPIDSELPLPSLDKFTGVLAPVAAGDLRKQLEASGLSKSMLDSLTDKELQELYVETLREVLATSTR